MRQQLLQVVEVVAVRGARHADQGGALGTQDAHQVGVTGVVHQHHVTRAHQRAHGEVECLAGAVGQHQLRRIGDDRQLLLQVLRSQRAQLRQAHGIAVAGKLQRAAGHLAQTAAQAFFVHPVVGQPAATWLERQLAGFEDLLQVPFGVERWSTGVGLGGVRVQQLGHRAVDEEPGIALAHQQPLSHQAIVSLDHGEGAHRIGRGERADRRDLGAWLEGLVVDQLTQPVDDLVDQRG